MPTHTPHTFEIIRPDDWHLHVRDGAMLQAVWPHTARIFGRALIMPNLRPPVVQAAQAQAYQKRILAVQPPLDAAVSWQPCTPVFALYLTQDTTLRDVEDAAADPTVLGFKLYPQGATTNAQAGVHTWQALNPIYAKMAELGVPLMVHGELPGPDIDPFDREARFLDEVLEPLHTNHPNLKITLEHVTTAEGVAWVQSQTHNRAASITAHHVLLNRGALFEGGLRPHHYCLPLLKRERHRQALLEAATTGDTRFFAGTDSAPHTQNSKESACGCAGIFTAHAAISLYAEAFAQKDALKNLEAFVSLNGARFYGLPPSQDRIRLTQKPWHVPQSYPVEGHEDLIPFRAAGELAWQVEPVHA